MNTSDVLNTAADLIEIEGWGQGPGSWSGCGANICVDEAIARALGFVGCNVPPRQGGIWPQDLAGHPSVVAVKAHVGDPDLFDLYAWNDEPGRTASEVIEVLRAVAVIEAAREQQPAEVSA